MVLGKKLIPDVIREQVSVIVAKFNQTELKTTNARYIARFQGRFLYLDRIAYGNKQPVIRMECFREINKWEFALNGVKKYMILKNTFSLEENWLMGLLKVQ